MGQVVSDLFYLGWKERQKSERFVRNLETTYCLEGRRVLGEEMRVLRCYPGHWQVYTWVDGVTIDDEAGKSPIRINKRGKGGTSQTGQWRLLSANEQEKPTYERLVALLKAAEGANNTRRSWLDRILLSGHIGSSVPSSSSGDGRRGTATREEERSGAMSDRSGVEERRGRDERDERENTDIVTGEILSPEQNNFKQL
jgi:hypothetical protein